MNPTLLITIVLACAGLSVGCSDGGTQPQSLPAVKMQLGKTIFTLEVADNEATQQIGLMFRDAMPADHGMVFVFDHAEVLGFWMKNTNIPLDIVYLSTDKRVVSIHQMEPHDLRTVSSDYAAQYAIELNQGAAEKCGVKVGDKIEFPPMPTSQPTTRSSR